MERTDMAHHEWDRRWKTSEGRADWIKPDPEVVEIIPVLRQRGFRDVLDLGCGVGRHALLLAAEGFSVTAMDGAALPDPISLAPKRQNSGLRSVRSAPK
jgi:tellurite methyltransferase